MAQKRKLPKDGWIGFIEVKDAKEARKKIKETYDIPKGSTVILSRRIPQKQVVGKRPIKYPYVYEAEVYIPPYAREPGY